MAASSNTQVSHRQLIIACVEDHPKAIMLLRTAQRRAQQQQCKWRAVFIETPTDARQMEDAPRERILRLLTLAEQMGGETAHIEAQTLEKGLESLLEKEKQRLALVIVGSAELEGHKYRFRSPSWIIAARVASQYTQVEIVPLSGHPYHRSLAEKLHLRSMHPQDALYAIAAVSIAYMGALLLQWLLPPALFRINDQNIGLLFMIACAFVAGRYGLLPGLVASIASFLTVNYYFTLPYHVLKVSTVTDFINMGLFLSAALLISLFTSQARNYAQNAARRERSTQALFTLYRIASEAHSRDQALETLQRRLERMLEVNVAFFLPVLMHPSRIEPAFPSGLELEAADRNALTAAWSEMKTTGVGSPFNPGTAWRFEPMISAAGEVGVLGVKPYGKTKLDPWFGRLLTAIADQTATVLQHIGLERSMEETRLREEREKLRSMLLSSVSHDFKTPLAGIVGALSVYRSLGKRLTQQKRDELIETAIDEAQRLDNFITNILDMTRLESGNIQFRKEWHDAEDMIENVVRRMQPRAKQHALIVIPCPASIDVCMDLLMIEQVLQNIIDNACKYTPPGTRIEVRSHIDKDKGFLCEIRDFGPGIPSEKLELIFDKYTRLHKKDTQIAGTGLGLAIAKAVMEAQGGWISAANHPDGGGLFTLCLPQWRPSARPINRKPEDEKDDAFQQAHRRY
jgi:two-component system sensor histidine kinase KdpD